MSLVKYYLTLLDFVRKTVKGTIDKNDFDKAFDAFIDISLYAREFGTQNSAMKEMYETYEQDKQLAEKFSNKGKNRCIAVKNEIECLNYTKTILDNASKGDLLSAGLENVLYDISREKKHEENLDKIDCWAYDKVGY